MEHCRREIAFIEDQLRAGHPDVYGLCLALADWSAELQMMETERQNVVWGDLDKDEEP